MRRDGLESYHLVGRHPNGDVWICELNDTVPETLGCWETLALMRLCEKVNTTPCCTIRARKEFNNEVVYYASFFSENPSPEDELAKDNALLRIFAAERNPNDPEGEAQAIASEARTLAQLGFGGGE